MSVDEENAELFNEAELSEVGSEPPQSPTYPTFSEGWDEKTYARYASDSDPANFNQAPEAEPADVTSEKAQGPGPFREPTLEDEHLATNQIRLNKAPVGFQIQEEILNDIADRIVRLYEEEQGLPSGIKGQVDFSQFLDIEHCHRLGSADASDAEKFVTNLNDLKADPVACRYLARRLMYFSVYELLDCGRSDFLDDEGNAALYQVWWSPSDERVGFSMLRKGKGKKRARSPVKDPEEVQRRAASAEAEKRAKAKEKERKQAVAAEKKRAAAEAKLQQEQAALERKRLAAEKKTGVEEQKAAKKRAKDEKERVAREKSMTSDASTVSWGYGWC
jgi:hypothetical protein